VNDRNKSAGDPTDGDKASVDQVLGDEELGGMDSQHESDTAQTELAETQDRLLRLQAELENYRRRSQRELQDALRYAGLPLMRELLPVQDNVNRAVEAADQTSDAAGLLAGVKMVADQLRDVLARHQCQPIEALHQPFDPNVHEAVSQQPSEEYPPGTVVQVVQSGYQLHDRVVRPAQVVVSTSPPEASN